MIVIVNRLLKIKISKAGPESNIKINYNIIVKPSDHP